MNYDEFRTTLIAVAWVGLLVFVLYEMMKAPDCFKDMDDQG